MRLSDYLKNKIKRGIQNSFGNVDVYLFGSRVDDAKKGGDIDIAVDTDLSPEQFKKCKIQFITEMMKMGLDLKIDVVPLNCADKLLEDEVHKTAIKL
ncbi:nucleotidyltransferase family protein [methane-oxidizing endosymbiont of Gigantopelta aegis]|uniref:nucleotidyltransferase family protein n=1 Tax=methane-oxidizing endosymbiont of Gigantopelta aegis TaxID=2794938 RepID=UPI0018DBB4E4|nr:nucleotidyltransferase domain-containing protein [methane-oxidizing endosymbiont of Gigantopelta aegis]